MNKKVEKLIVRLNALVDHMHRHPRDLTIHRRMDLYYYLQMETELKLLSERFIEVSGRLKVIEGALEEKYRQAFFNWQKDARWLTGYLSSLENNDDRKLLTP